MVKCWVVYNVSLDKIVAIHMTRAQAREDAWHFRGHVRVMKGIVSCVPWMVHVFESPK